MANAVGGDPGAGVRVAAAGSVRGIPIGVRVARRPWAPGGPRLLGLAAGVAGLLVAATVSLRYGAHGLGARDAWEALFAYDPTSYDQTVVRTLRLPRTLIGLAVGGALGVAGATMQAVTRNPLAEPTILGVSSGASFAIVVAVTLLGRTQTSEFLWFAFAGALGAAVLVFAVGSAGGGGASPLKLALAGVVISALLTAWTNAVLLLDQQSLEIVRFWLAGSVAGRDLETFWTVAPFLIGGSLACVFLGHQLNVLSMGDDAARGLGMRPGRTRLLCGLLVVLIAGAATAAAGPIAFVGLATPHVVRSVVGPDYRWVLPYSLVFGGIFLTVADVVGRVLPGTGEVEVGIVTAVAGAPFLIALARRRTVAV